MVTQELTHDLWVGPKNCDLDCHLKYEGGMWSLTSMSPPTTCGYNPRLMGYKRELSSEEDQGV